MKTPAFPLALASRTTAAIPALVILLASARAEAFCRTTTVRDGNTDASGCITEGMALYHPLAKLSYRVVPSEPTIPTALLTEKMAKAFAHWTARNSRCTPGIEIEVLPQATSSGAPITGFDIRGGNFNNVGVPKTMNGSGDESVLPTLHYRQQTGAILDVDLEISPAVKWSFGDEGPPADGTDLEAVLTHNAGHVLGLAHSDDPTSAMFANYEPGSITQRTLNADDMDAMCTIYPSKEQRLSATGLVATSRCGSTLEDPDNNCAFSGASGEGTDGCSASPGGHRGFLLPGIAAAIALVAAARRRRA